MPRNVDGRQPQQFRLAGRLLTVLAGLAAGLLLVELLTRLLPPPYPQTEFNPNVLVTCDRTVGWRGLPGQSVEFATEGYAHSVSWNSAGFHDGEHAVEKPPGVYRVMVLGDSFLEALQVNEAESSHQLLEQLLNETAPPGQPVEVISAGVSGWGPAQELAYFQNEGYRYQPDLLLVFWYSGNDLQDNLPVYRRTSTTGINCYAPYFSRCSGQFDPAAWAAAPGLAPSVTECALAGKWAAAGLNWLYHHSRLYQHLEPLLIDPAARWQYSPVTLPWLPEGYQEPALAYSFQLTGDIYAELARLPEQYGGRALFALLPYKMAVYSEVDPAFVEVLRAEAPGIDRAEPTLANTKMAALLTERGLSVFDMQPGFVDYLRQGGPTPFWEGDSHWNVAGNRLAATLLADQLWDECSTLGLCD